MSGCWAAAKVKGVEREPGEMQAYLTPERTNSSIIRLAHARLIFAGFRIIADFL
jgi:hypothetical protein